ncbi:MAG TPA: protein-L-isoaspartate(D-aspartate) O-methyltransferase [Gemmatimonadales bacterium]|nr:protein-L-isoaspartate(D-aspartate) O-methyltransferase [Gemmatimonadales bacterium]
MSAAKHLWLGGLTALVLTVPVAAQRDHEDGRWRKAREQLVQQLRRVGIQDSTTLAAMGAVPRHEFVPPEYRVAAYEDTPLPIGSDQTISQPAVVALMTELVRPGPGRRVLEVGTGSGYQAAVLAQAGCAVWTIEIFAGLARDASRRLKRLGYSRVRVRHGDGYLGWPAESPFDAILVTAAADSIPPALIDQLGSGGRLVMPVGDPDTDQDLILVDKDSLGRVTTRRVIPVRFVPLLRGVR